MASKLSTELYSQSTSISDVIHFKIDTANKNIPTKMSTRDVFSVMPPMGQV